MSITVMGTRNIRVSVGEFHHFVSTNSLGAVLRHHGFDMTLPVRIAYFWSEKADLRDTLYEITQE